MKIVQYSSGLYDTEKSSNASRSPYSSFSHLSEHGIFAQLQPFSNESVGIKRKRFTDAQDSGARRLANIHAPSVSAKELSALLKGDLDASRDTDGRVCLGAILTSAGRAGRIFGFQLDEHSSISLQGMRLTGITFENCTLDWSHLSDAVIENCTFKNCKFINTSSARSKFSHCTFERCEFKQAMFPGSTLSHVTFYRCWIEYGSFEDASISDSEFFRCTMPGTHFLSASVHNTRLRHCDVSDTAFFRALDDFQLDAATGKTAHPTRNVAAMLVFPESAGVSTPRIFTKLDSLCDMVPLRVAAQTPKSSADDVNAEVKRLFKRIRLDKGRTLSIAERLLTEAATYPSEFPHVCGIMAKARELAGGVDWIVLPGGEDVPPKWYGDSSEHPKTNWGGDYRRSIMEFALIREAKRRQHQPLTGICRGFQMLNVYLGATLLQHIGDDQRGVWELQGKDIGGGFYGEALKELTTASYYHQGVLDGQAQVSGIKPSFVSNGRVMAVEPVDADAAPFSGMQFHPEFYDAGNAVDTKLTAEQGEALSGAPRNDGEQDKGLRDPASLVSSGVIKYMSAGNDEIWRMLSKLTTQYHWQRITAHAPTLQRQKARLGPLKAGNPAGFHVVKNG